MKLTCDLCGGSLQVNPGGQGATCTACGLAYPMERLREKLGIQPTVQQDPPKPVPPEPVPPKPAPEEEIIYDVTDWQKADDPKPAKEFDFVPQQFVMENNGRNGDLSGWVRQGGIGLGDSVYIDGDYDHPYRVYSINDDPYTTCAKEGMPAGLFIDPYRSKVCKNARVVTGDPNPVANAYNYPGTVREYFSNLLLCAFSQYEIHADVPHDELKIPVSFMFCQDKKPVLAVFLVGSNDSKARYQVEKAARICALEGVACTHFFEDYRNDMPYVIDRIRGTLG